MINLGVLGYGALASVDDCGAVDLGDLFVDWFVGADDRWHLPTETRSTQQHRVGAAPVVDTRVRVPGGEVVHRSYGTAARAGAVVVVEVENQSPVPLSVALVVRVARRAAVEVDGSVLCIDGQPALAMSRPPGAWAAGTSTAETVMQGGARTGPVDALVGPVEIALLFPVPHRTTVRVAVSDVREPARPREAGEAMPLAVRDLPSADTVARGWDRQLERGLQAQLPAPMGEQLDAARADLLLAPRREAMVVAALEDWGFDDEAANGWSGLGWRARRRARRRIVEVDPWAALRPTDPNRDPARFLSALRAVLARERRGAVELLPGYPPEWLGQSVTVDSLPLPEGLLSFAVRWHGARPALLWDAPPGVELRAPALDPAWASNAASGETLLAEPPQSLLPMGTQERSDGYAVEAPGQFS